MPRTQVFVFDLYDKVTLVDINRPAVITGLLVGDTGRPEYRVLFWNDCVRRTEWVYEHEIKMREET
jgi:hypothetical protein